MRGRIGEQRAQQAVGHRVPCPVADIAPEDRLARETQIAERIEQIRVNNVLDFIFFQATQAEVIGVLTVLAGVIGLILTTKRRAAEQPSGASTQEATA